MCRRPVQCFYCEQSPKGLILQSSPPQRKSLPDVAACGCPTELPEAGRCHELSFHPLSSGPSQAGGQDFPGHLYYSLLYNLFTFFSFFPLLVPSLLSPPCFCSISPPFLFSDSFPLLVSWKAALVPLLFHKAQSWPPFSFFHNPQSLFCSLPPPPKYLFTSFLCSPASLSLW